MTFQQESISIRTTGSRVGITLKDCGGLVFFDAESSSDVHAGIPERLAALRSLGGSEELVFSFEFEAVDPQEHTDRALRKLDAHVGDFSVTEHDDGMVLEGDLKAWIGYTHATARSA